MLDGHRRGHRRLHRQLLGRVRRARGAAGRFPNLLVNGSQGIAVGMATNIPPHNLGEVIDAAEPPDRPSRRHPRRPHAVRQGPRLPDGRLIMGRPGIIDAYRTGRGSIRLRADAEIEESSDGRTQIVVTELPYQTSRRTRSPARSPSW